MTDEKKVDVLAKLLWDYLQLREEPKKSDIIFCLCSHDIRVAQRAADLMLEGYGKYIVFSGGSGKLTEGLFTKPEADVFADIAIKSGIEKSKILIENKSANTGENIKFTYDLLIKSQIQIDSIVLVQKPYMERRTFATFMKQWPTKDTTITVTSPKLSYEDYMRGGIDKELVINVMVGDMQRIREYPKLGFQIEQDIPEGVWQAFKRLVKLGFDSHLLTS